jgi:hypothetical protein
MKLLLVLLPFAATTWACAYTYHWCHCRNADYSPNDAATTQICTGAPPGWAEGLGGTLQNMPGGGVECAAPNEANLFDNCDVQEMCQACDPALFQDCRGKDGLWIIIIRGFDVMDYGYVEYLNYDRLQLGGRCFSDWPSSLGQVLCLSRSWEHLFLW